MSDLDLARRAVALPRWRWLGGCRWRFAIGSHADVWSRYNDEMGDDDAGNAVAEGDPRQRGPVMIDLSDPATLGCVDALVREAWGEDARLIAETQDGEHDIVGWLVFSRSLHALWCDADTEYPRGSTRIEALIAALEAAPPEGDAMTYADQARARGWVRIERYLGSDPEWIDPNAAHQRDRVWIHADLEEAASWRDRNDANGAPVWVAADNEEDAIRLALAAWPEVKS